VRCGEEECIRATDAACHERIGHTRRKASKHYVPRSEKAKLYRNSSANTSWRTELVAETIRRSEIEVWGPRTAAERAGMGSCRWLGEHRQSTGRYPHIRRESHGDCCVLADLCALRYAPVLSALPEHVFAANCIDEGRVYRTPGKILWTQAFIGLRKRLGRIVCYQDVSQD